MTTGEQKAENVSSAELLFVDRLGSPVSVIRRVVRNRTAFFCINQRIFGGGKSALSYIMYIVFQFLREVTHEENRYRYGQ